MSKIYGLDMDGVLADFVWGFTSLANRMYGTPIITTHSQLEWDFHSMGLTPEQHDELWRVIDVDEEFWADLPPLITAEEAVWLSLRTEPYFITSRLGDTAQLQTEAWLRNTFGMTATGKVHLAHGHAEKVRVAKELGVTVAIDDRVDIANAYAEAGIRSYLMRRQYNRAQEKHPAVREVGAMMEFLNEEVGR